MPSAADLDEAFPDERFDAIVTDSALSHLPPDRVRDILSGLVRRLAPGGRIALIENPFSPASVMESLRHGGRWLHNLAECVDGLCDVDIVDGFADGRHALYLLSPARLKGASAFTYRASPAEPAVAYDLAGLRGLHGERADAAGRALSEEAGAPEESAAARDDLRALERKVADLTAELDRTRHALAKTRRSVEERRRLADVVAAAITSVRTSTAGQTEPKPAPVPDTSAEPPVHWNAARDLRYTRHDARFDGVLHVFHQEWVGIRAAAGSLPGAKLAITADRPLPGEVQKDLIERLRSDEFSRIVVHGLSDNTAMMIEALAALGLRDKVFLVYHGSPTQWLFMPERRFAFLALDLARAGRLRKFHLIKAGFDFPLDRLYRPMLFNLSPRLPEAFPIGAPDAAEGEIAFVPGWSGFIKNVFTNALAAAQCPAVAKVWGYAPDLVLPPPFAGKLSILPFKNREATLDAVRLSSFLMNVSLADCHPMVNVESQVLGRPCIRGPLALDALEDHPYVRLTAVRDPSSIREIRAVIERLLSAPPAERTALALDYQQQSDAVAIDRYCEFLEL